MYIIADAETKDPNIDNRSWPMNECVPLGFALLSEDRQYSGYYTDMELVLEIISHYDTIICHNLQYDCGILTMLGYDIYKHTLIDTMNLAFLYKSTDFRSLELLAKKYVNFEKKNDKLVKLAAELKEREIEPFYTSRKNPLKLIKQNMDLAQEYDYDVIEEYALADVEATELLYKFYIDNIETPLRIDFYSDLLKCMIKCRSKGVPVNINSSDELLDNLKIEIDSYKKKAFEIAGREFSLTASDDFRHVIDSLGIKCKLSEKTNKILCDKPFMESNPHPIFQNILQYRKLNNIWKRIKTEWPESIKDNKMHPQQVIFGAKTGRPSGKKPNIFNIPRRDEVAGPICRSIFVAPPGKDWFCADYSTQEPRIAIHLSYKLGLDGVEQFVDAYHDNPKFDLYEPISIACFGAYSKKNRDVAKVVLLAYLYGRGAPNMAAQLGITVDEAKYLKIKFGKKFPFLPQLNEKIKETVQEKGYIMTLGKRRVYQGQEPDYKMINFAIQGGAADQTYAAMVALYQSDIDILFNVYDEIDGLIPSGNLDKVEEIRYIMETSTKLVIPSSVDIKIGKTWAECK